jgi:hypothetical protein
MPTRQSRRRQAAIIHLTTAERDMLLAHGDPVAGFTATFRDAPAHGPLVRLELAGDELDDFLDAFEQTANSAQNEVAMERLGQAFARIEAGFAGETDPGWHMLRPALSRVDISAKQGQYVAFIQTYTRLHRRAPAESEIQDYFQTTPPSVHGMLNTLQRRGFISRVPGVARSTKVLLAPHEIPELE